MENGTICLLAFLPLFYNNFVQCEANLCDEAKFTIGAKAITCTKISLKNLFQIAHKITQKKSEE